MDRYVPPWLGRRSSWILLTQFGMAWAPFFFVTFLTTLPRLAILVWLRPVLSRLDRNADVTAGRP